jgi:flagellar basal-body rod protein FlgC
MSDTYALLPSVQISASGLEAENVRMQIAANNAANAQTTRGPDGKTYRRKEVVFAAELKQALGGHHKVSDMQGVRVDQIVDDPRPATRVFRPGHPDADQEGYVNMPNVNPMEEMVSMMSASRAYEANLAAIKNATDMARKALEIGK